MRRNWLTILLVALALTVQVFAPVAGNVAVAKALGEASESIDLCLKAAGSADDRQQTPGQLHSHRDACALCQAFCDGSAPLAARLLSSGMAPVQWTALDWTLADGALPTPHHEHSRQARAPPSLS